jgi:D-Tyr-tRNAtyr deacylase
MNTHTHTHTHTHTQKQQGESHKPTFNFENKEGRLKFNIEDVLGKIMRIQQFVTFFNALYQNYAQNLVMSGL